MQVELCGRIDVDHNHCCSPACLASAAAATAAAAAGLRVAQKHAEWQSSGVDRGKSCLDFLQQMGYREYSR